MSGLLFNADCASVTTECASVKPACRSVDDGRICQRERRSLETWTPIHAALAQPANWRRKQRTKTNPKHGVVSTPSEGETRAEAGQRSRTYGICCPTQFFRDEFVQKIEANRAHENQRWIFELIKNPEATTEEVFINKPGWMLVKGNPHANAEERYLVVFKDLELRTIRDLRAKHVNMLQEVDELVTEHLKKKHASRDFKMYFHYLPSVFQLHMHVCSSSVSDSIRRQYLHCVVANIQQKDTWYRDALILFAPPRGLRTQGAHVVGNGYVSEDTTPDKPDGVDI